MGRESRVEKFRKCPFCEVELPQTSQELKEHTKKCGSETALKFEADGTLAQAGARLPTLISELENG